MKSNMYLIVTFLLLIGFTEVRSQDVLISEYFNIKGTPNGEWTELIVNKDCLSLVGAVLRDNAGSTGVPNKWQGGVKFRNVSLWRTLRNGTIIVINHRGSEVKDSDPNDGYLELGAENSTYFDKACYDCDTSNWRYKALSIAQESDIVELLDSNSNHIHSLSHIPVPGGDYLNLPFTKANYPGSLTDSSSVRVVPGKNLSDYTSGSGNVFTYAGANNITKGLPNKSSNSVNENQLFWRKLREPSWSNKPHSLKADLSPIAVNISWTALDDNNPSDNQTGYMLVRMRTRDTSAALAPDDGRIYSPGSLLGPAVVLTNISYSKGNSFMDYLKVDCGYSYVYRLYIYRYSADNFGMDYLSENARGRSYNEIEYTDLIVERKYPDTPELYVKEKSVLCDGDSAIIAIRKPLSGYFYEWYKDKNFITSVSSDSLVVYTGGTYSLRIEDSTGCWTASNDIFIKSLSAHFSKLSVDGNYITYDTTIKFCTKGSSSLTASNGDTYEWYENKSFIGSSDNIIVDREGTYYAIVKNGDCIDTTPKVTILFNRQDYTLDNHKLTFRISKTIKDDIKELKITNLGKDTLIIDRLIKPVYFSVINQVNPYRIPPGGYINLKIKFNPDTVGTYEDRLVLYGPCGADIVYLTGMKENGSRITSKPESIDFGKLLLCSNEYRDTTIIIRNPEKDTVIALSANTGNGFSIISPSFPISLMPLETKEVKIRFKPTATVNYLSTLTVVYEKEKDMQASCQIALIGSGIEPVFSLSVTNINLSAISECDDYKDTAISIRNEGRAAIILAEQSKKHELKYLNLPLIIDSGEVKELLIRFIPSAQGNFNISDELVFQPCNITRIVSINGVKNGITYTFDKDTVDFGITAYCGGDIKLVKTVKLNINGASDQKVKVKKLDLPESFSSDLSIGRELIEDNTFNITFQPKKEGQYNGMITIGFDSCNIEKRLIVRGEAKLPSITLKNNFLDFGETIVSRMIEKALEIKNTGEMDVKIDSITGVVPPYYIASKTVQLPVCLKPDSILSIYLRFIPDNIGTYSLTYRVNSSEPCNISQEGTISGRGVSSDNIRVKLSIKGGLLGTIGETMEIPLYILPDTTKGNSDLLVDSLDVFIKYNEQVIYPESVKPYGIFNSNISAVSRIISPGKLGFKIKCPNHSIPIDGGYFAALSCKILWGNEFTTYVEVDSSKIYSDRIVMTENSGDTIRIFSDCSYLKKLFSGGSLMLNIKGENPVREMLSMSLSLISDDRTSLLIYNSIGEIEQILIDKDMKAGTYEINLPVGLLSGVYHIVLRNGWMSVVKNVVVAR